MKTLIIVLSLLFSGALQANEGDESGESEDGLGKQESNNSQGWVTCDGFSKCREINLDKVFVVSTWKDDGITVIFYSGSDYTESRRDSMARIECLRLNLRVGRHCLSLE